MAIRRRRHSHSGKGDRRKHAKELSERLAPPEEQEAAAKSKDAAARNGGGAQQGQAPDDTIRVDAKNLKFPEKFLEEERGAARVFRLEPVALVILVAFLAFVAFVAWQITLMPPPAK